MSNLGDVSVVEIAIDAADVDFEVVRTAATVSDSVQPNVVEADEAVADVDDDDDDADSRFDAAPTALTTFRRTPSMFNPSSTTPTAFSEIEVGSDLLLGEEADWHERALCAQTDPEAFFPEKGGSTREAKKICTGCEVRAECLTYALANDERFGIWGGLSERERRRLKRSAG